MESESQRKVTGYGTGNSSKIFWCAGAPPWVMSRLCFQLGGLSTRVRTALMYFFPHLFYDKHHTHSCIWIFLFESYLIKSFTAGKMVWSLNWAVYAWERCLSFCNWCHITRRDHRLLMALSIIYSAMAIHFQWSGPAAWLKCTVLLWTKTALTWCNLSQAELSLNASIMKQWPVWQLTGNNESRITAKYYTKICFEGQTGNEQLHGSNLFRITVSCLSEFSLFPFTFDATKWRALPVHEF